MAAEVPTGTTNPPAQFIIHSCQKSKHLISEGKKKKKTRDFKEKQPGDFVSWAVEFSGIKLQFHGQHCRERLLLDASCTSPQADLWAVDTAEENEKMISAKG